jgi:SAM-dependent methyltransferase
LAWAYFAQHSQLFSNGGVFVHIAPEYQLGKWLKRKCKQTGMRYCPGDIRDRKHTMDIQSTGLAPESVDVLCACHVLNMVENDQLAMREIKRVLKPEGVAFIPVPIMDIFAEVTPGEGETGRKALFNDSMMYRAYSQAEYSRRLETAGLSLGSFTPEDVQIDSAEQWKVDRVAVHIATPRS